MKRVFNMGLVATFSIGLLTGCASGSDTYESFNDLTEALAKAGIECEQGKTVTNVDFGGIAKTCNSAQIMYIYPDAESTKQAVKFHDTVRQGILVTPWVVGENWYVITNDENADKIQRKAGGEVTIIGSE